METMYVLLFHGAPFQKTHDKIEFITFHHIIPLVIKKNISFIKIIEIANSDCTDTKIRNSAKIIVALISIY